MLRRDASMRETRLHSIWTNMKSRCYNEKTSSYENYGAKGITVCELWKNSFNEFAAWALLNGYEEDLSIDRIESSLNYEPSNCRFATDLVQANNRGIHKDNTSGATGVYFRKDSGTYRVIKTFYETKISKSGFKTFDDAKSYLDEEIDKLIKKGALT